MKFYALIAILIFPLKTFGTDFFRKESGITYAASNARDCLNFGDNETANECVSYLHTASEHQLDLIFQEIKNKVIRDKKLLMNAQDSWLSFKKNECEVQSVSAQAYRDPFSQKQIFIAVCAEELNKARIIQLNSIFLGCDSCLQ